MLFKAVLVAVVMEEESSRGLVTVVLVAVSVLAVEVAAAELDVVKITAMSPTNSSRRSALPPPP